MGRDVVTLDHFTDIGHLNAERNDMRSQLTATRRFVLAFVMLAATFGVSKTATAQGGDPYECALQAYWECYLGCMAINQECAQYYWWVDYPSGTCNTWIECTQN